jgi:hypothetical protein
VGRLHELPFMDHLTCAEWIQSYALFSHLWDALRETTLYELYVKDGWRHKLFWQMDVASPDTSSYPKECVFMLKEIRTFGTLWLFCKQLWSRVHALFGKLITSMRSLPKKEDTLLSSEHPIPESMMQFVPTELTYAAQGWHALEQQWNIAFISHTFTSPMGTSFLAFVAQQLQDPALFANMFMNPQKRKLDRETRKKTDEKEERERNEEIISEDIDQAVLSSDGEDEEPPAKKGRPNPFAFLVP